MGELQLPLFVTQADAFGAAAKSVARYFNTTHLTEPDLSDAIADAKDQDAAVLAIFHAHDCALSPSRVWRFGNARGSQWLLTSVRRSITTLTKAGKLVKFSAKVKGIHGRAEYLWGLPV